MADPEDDIRGAGRAENVSPRRVTWRSGSSGRPPHAAPVEDVAPEPTPRAGGAAYAGTEGDPVAAEGAASPWGAGAGAAESRVDPAALPSALVLGVPSSTRSIAPRLTDSLTRVIPTKSSTPIALGILFLFLGSGGVLLGTWLTRRSAPPPAPAVTASVAPAAPSSKAESDASEAPVPAVSPPATPAEPASAPAATAAASAPRDAAAPPRATAKGAGATGAQKLPEKGAAQEQKGGAQPPAPSTPARTGDPQEPFGKPNYD